MMLFFVILFVFYTNKTNANLLRLTDSDIPMPTIKNQVIDINISIPMNKINEFVQQFDASIRDQIQSKIIEFDILRGDTDNYDDNHSKHNNPILRSELISFWINTVQAYGHISYVSFLIKLTNDKTININGINVQTTTSIPQLYSSQQVCWKETKRIIGIKYRTKNKCNNVIGARGITSDEINLVQQKLMNSVKTSDVYISWRNQNEQINEHNLLN